MSDRSYLILAAALVAAVAVDLTALDGIGTLYVLRKLAALVEYLSFWR